MFLKARTILCIYLHSKVKWTGYLLPPAKMCSMPFLKKVLNGKKQLLKMTDSGSIPHIPRLPEISLEKFWNELKNDDDFSQYFPDAYYNEGRVPDRRYFFTVK